MFIYLIGSPDVSVPPTNYGGVELVLAPFAAGLAANGHVVTLFAAEGSHVAGVRCINLLRHRPVIGDRQIFTREIAHAELARQFILNELVQHPEWQTQTLVHFHTDAVLPVGNVPCIVTAHNGPRLTLPVLLQDCEERILPLPTIVGISASNEAECRAAGLETSGYIYSDVPLTETIEHARPTKGGFRGISNYVAFLGRFDSDKGAGKAIKWVRRYNEGKVEEEQLTLLLAAKPADNAAAQIYFKEEVEPHLGDKVQFIGPIGGLEKIEFLSKALALLFPIQWQEPFGLVPVEAMAAGTPVIARPLGAVRETVADGISGFHVNTTVDAVQAIAQVVAGEISREDCQAQARRFETGMVEAYEILYRELLVATDA
jgi:glycosyltransferase involved in cell wall biosynthesis